MIIIYWIVTHLYDFSFIVCILATQIALTLASLIIFEVVEICIIII